MGFSEIPRGYPRHSLVLVSRLLLSSFSQLSKQLILLISPRLLTGYYSALVAVEFAESEIGFRVRLWILWLVLQCPDPKASSLRHFRMQLPQLAAAEFHNVSLKSFIIFRLPF
jgi:hypothetical protein